MIKKADPNSYQGVLSTSNGRKIIQDLIRLGQEKGHLLHDDINVAFKNVALEEFDIEDIFDLLKEQDIIICKNLKQAQGIAANRQTIKKEVEASETGVGDPVKMYLKEMGTIDLLCHDEEITIAKNIESAEKVLSRTVFATCYAAEQFVKMKNMILSSDENIDIREFLDMYQQTWILRNSKSRS